MPELLKLVAAVNGKRYPESRLVQRIRNDLSFSPDQETLQQLETAHATQRVLDEVRKHLPVQPPPAPEPPRDATLTVLCAPVDCSISINGETRGATEKGTSTPIRLKEGSYTVRAAAAEGYETNPSERTLTLKSGAGAMVSFNFQLSRAGMNAFGKKMYDRVVSGLGGIGTLKDADKFVAKGNLTLSNDQSGWGFLIYYRAPDMARFELTRGGKTFTVIHSPSGYTWIKGKAPLQASALEDVLMKACHFQVAGLLKQLGATQFTLIVNSPVTAPGLDATLRAEGTPDTYVLLIDSDARVKQVVIESPGVSNGIRAIYTGYPQQGKLGVPATTQVLLPEVNGKPRTSVELQFAEVLYNPPSLTEDAFLPRPLKKLQAERK